MRKIIAALTVIMVLAPATASAAVIFDSTNAGNKGAGFPSISNNPSVNCAFPGDPQQHFLSASFEYTSSSSVFINEVNVRTLSSISHDLCLLWTNEVGASGYKCATAAASSPSYATTTFTYADGEKPYTVISGEKLTFQWFDATTMPSGFEIDGLQKDETGFPEIATMTSYCGDTGDYKATNLAIGTYGVPSIQFLGNSTPGATPPNPEDYGLSGTSTAATQDFGFFGNLFRDVLIWLFQPPATVTTAYQNQVAILQTKVPWGWWTQISDGFMAVSSTQAATTTALSMEVPHNGVTTTVAIFDIAAARALIPESVLSLIRSIGAVAIWALFGTWIWILVTGSKPEDDV